MFRFSILCAVFLIPGHFWESLCFERTTTDYFGEIYGIKFKNENKKAWSQFVEAKQIEDPSGYNALFPRAADNANPSFFQNTWTKVRSCLKFEKYQTLPKEVPISGSEGFTPFFEKLSRSKSTGSQTRGSKRTGASSPKKTADKDAALLKCMATASKKSMSDIPAVRYLVDKMGSLVQGTAQPVVPQPVAKSTQRRKSWLFRSKSQTVPAPPPAEPAIIDPKTVSVFVEASKRCFGLFDRDSEGNLKLAHNFAMSVPAEAIKLSPYGALAVGTADAVVRNVKVESDEDGKIKWDVNPTGLAFGMGMAIAAATKFGHLVRVYELARLYVEWMSQHPSQNQNQEQ